MQSDVSPYIHAGTCEMRVIRITMAPKHHPVNDTLSYSRSCTAHDIHMLYYIFIQKVLHSHKVHCMWYTVRANTEQFFSHVDIYSARYWHNIHTYYIANLAVSVALYQPGKCCCCARLLCWWYSTERQMVMEIVKFDCGYRLGTFLCLCCWLGTGDFVRLRI